MGRVVVDLSVSLDGFITAPAPGPQAPLGVGGERLHDWLLTGDTPSAVSPMFRPIAGSRAVFEESARTTGAVVMGRRWFDMVEGWGGRPPLPVPHFVLTHAAPAGWTSAGSPFSFASDLDAAIGQARAAAGERDVVVGGASVAQQALAAGLLDQVQLHVVPVLFGGGTRLFADVRAPVALEQIAVVHSQDVTHLRFQVVKATADG